MASSHHEHGQLDKTRQDSLVLRQSCLVRVRGVICGSHYVLPELFKPIHSRIC